MCPFSNHRRWISIVSLLLLSGIVSLSYGSGFAIVEQSASGIGNAFSGSSTLINDPSCMYYNPACMTQLDGYQVSLGAHAIMPSFKFTDEGSTGPGGMPLLGDDGIDAGVTAFVPNLYYMQSVCEKFRVGLGITAPFGLATEYDDDWMGRYHAIDTELQTLNINPSFAWQICDMVSLGGGLSAQYIKAKLTSAIDFGGIVHSYGDPTTMPQSMDGKAKIEGDDWGWGFNLGLLVTPLENLRIGLAYRSKIKNSLSGDAKFDVPTGSTAMQQAILQGIKAGGMFVDCDASADIDLPENASLGVAYTLGKWDLLADIQWTKWSRFEELRVDYDSNQPDSITIENWDDTWRYAIGCNYHLNEQWTLRAGTAYDSTPVPDGHHRTPRIPDGDRLWLSLGAGFQATEALSFDAGYTYLKFDDTDMTQTGATGDVLKGKYEGYVNIISIQGTYKF